MSSASALSASRGTVQQTSEWLRTSGFEEHIEAFVENDIDGSALLELTQEELKDDLKIGSFGKRKAIVREIEKLKPSKRSNEVTSIIDSPKKPTTKLELAPQGPLAMSPLQKTSYFGIINASK